MFHYLTIFGGFLRRKVKKYKDGAENNRFTISVFIVLSIFLFSLKTTSGQGQGTLLGRAFEGYIEETAALIDLNLSVRISSEEDEFFLSPSLAVPVAAQNFPRNLSQESLLPYQSVLSIFGDAQRNQVITYTVQEGDVLSQIANDFGISVSSLIWANNLKDSDYLTPGQELKIPPVSGVIHVVKKGDTVQSIAKKYSAKESEIIEFNGLPKDGNLQLGQEIVVPGGKIQIAGQLMPYSSRIRFASLPDLGNFFIQPTQGYNWGRVHSRNGVDIANLCGTPVQAAASGLVIVAAQSGWNAGAGKYVKINHNEGVATLYAHLSQVLVEAGQFVSQGQIIGLMGSTGRSTGCHLHFEVHGARNPLARY